MDMAGGLRELTEVLRVTSRHGAEEVTTEKTREEQSAIPEESQVPTRDYKGNGSFNDWTEQQREQRNQLRIAFKRAEGSPCSVIGEQPSPARTLPSRFGSAQLTPTPSEVRSHLSSVILTLAGHGGGLHTERGSTRRRG